MVPGSDTARNVTLLRPEYTPRWQSAGWTLQRREYHRRADVLPV